MILELRSRLMKVRQSEYRMGITVSAKELANDSEAVLDQVRRGETVEIQGIAPNGWNDESMKTRSTVTVTELHAQTPKVMREAHRRGMMAVTEKGRVAAFIVSRDRIMAMIETMEILSNPEAMRAVREFESGKTRMYPVSTLDED